MSPRSSLREKRTKVSAGSSLALLTVFLCLVFAAGGGQAGLGLLFLAGGSGLLLFPPERALPRSWLWAGAALIALMVCSLIPGMSVLSGEWRKEMTEIYDVSVFSGLTAQPWITWDGMLFLTGGMILFGYWALQMPDPQTRRQVLRIFALIMTLFSLLILAVYFGNYPMPGWHSPRNLGPFENRNQLSSILAVSLLVLLALFANDIKKHRTWALVWVLAASAQFYLLVLNYSRAGVVLLFLGGLAWMVLNFDSGRAKGKWALMFVALALLLSSFFLFGGNTLSRFETSGAWLEFAGSARLAIQQDTLSLIKDQCLSGVGLGNFAEVFPQYRSTFQSDSFVRHPESDWLWLTAELGIPGLLLFLVLGGLWLRGVFPLKSGTDKHLRSICLVSVLVVAVHGLVDVPLHRAGVVLPVLFLASLALQSLEQGRTGLWAERCWRMVGVGMLFWGLVTLVEAAGLWSKPGQYRVAGAVEKLPVLWAENKKDDALSLINRALASGPMTWELYYWRAAFQLKSGEVSGARDDFRRARFFEKNSSHLPMYESLQWLPVRPGLAVSAANEMLQRSRYATEVKFRTVLDEALRLGDEDVVEQLRLLARRYPELEHYYLETAPEAEFDSWLNDNKRSSRHGEAHWFWTLLQKRKSDDYLLEWASDRPDILKRHYVRLAGMLASKNEWQKAYFLVKNQMPAAVLPEPDHSDSARDDAGKKHLLYPEDLAAAGRVIRADMDEGSFNTALVKILAVLEKKTPPSHFYYLAAICYEKLEDWERAFLSLRRYDELRGRP